jgi:hypothetical protein
VETHWFFAWKMNMTVSPGTALTLSGVNVRLFRPTSTVCTVCAAARLARVERTAAVEKNMAGSEIWRRGEERRKTRLRHRQPWRASAERGHLPGLGRMCRWGKRESKLRRVLGGDPVITVRRRHGTATRLLLLADTIMSTVTVALRAARRAAATRTFSSSARRREHFLDADATVRALRPILCAC